MPGLAPKSDGDPGNPDVDFRGERRSNATHESTTDPDAHLARRKGTESRLALQGHVPMENRNGLVVDTRLTLATGTAEREAALETLGKLASTRRRTLGGNRGYDVRDFVERLRERIGRRHGRSTAGNGRADFLTVVLRCCLGRPTTPVIVLC